MLRAILDMEQAAPSEEENPVPEDPETEELAFLRRMGLQE